MEYAHLMGIFRPLRGQFTRFLSKGQLGRVISTHSSLLSGRQGSPPAGAAVAGEEPSTFLSRNELPRVWKCLPLAGERHEDSHFRGKSTGFL